MQNVVSGVKKLLTHLGLQQEPFGVFYSDEKPEPAFAPPVGQPISRELEQEGQVDPQRMMREFSCLIGNLWLARKKNCAAYISIEQYGCVGGSYYSAMYDTYLEFIPHYVSTGFPNTPMKGERYMTSPDVMRIFLDAVKQEKQPKKYCIIKPLTQFTGNEEPLLVIFFARPEVLSGLFTLTTFTTGDVNCVASPFGAGCTNIIAWPLIYAKQGLERAVIGGFDPSARKFMKTDELTFTVPLGLLKKMLRAMPDSLLGVEGSWPTVYKKVQRSSKAWGEDT